MRFQTLASIALVIAAGTASADCYIRRHVADTGSDRSPKRMIHFTIASATCAQAVASTRTDTLSEETELRKEAEKLCDEDKNLSGQTKYVVHYEDSRCVSAASQGATNPASLRYDPKPSGGRQ
jgi:hypothetical protein